MTYQEATAAAAGMTNDGLLSLLEGNGWLLEDHERDDTSTLRAMVTCDLYQNGATS